jgi:hypothetical protein
MVRSLAVVVGFALVLFAFVWWQRPEGQGTVEQVVDVPDVVAAVAPTAGFRLVVPDGLGAGWTATSAWSEGALSSGIGGVVVHIGYLTPSGSYAELWQTDGEPASAIDTWAAGSQQTGTTTVAGRTWQTWESDTQRALVERQGAVSRMVTGKAGWAELMALASSLGPVPSRQASSSSSS